MGARMISIALVLVLGQTSIAAAESSSASQPAPPTDAQGSGTLSDKLSKSNGVIRPSTDVDPGLGKAPPPTGEAMPVVPPPGSPDADPNVQPK